jgi:phage shock protein A
MDEMDKDVEQLVQSYFDTGWEEFEDNAKVKEIVAEMKNLSEMYLKVKASDAEDSVANAKGLEAQLQRLKDELTKTVTKLRKNKKSKPEVEYGGEMESFDGASEKSVNSKLPLIALALSVIALAVAAAAIYLTPGDYASTAELAVLKKTVQQSVGQDSEAKEAVRTELDTLKTEIESLKQDIETAKLNQNIAIQENADRISGELNKMNLRLGSLQDNLKKGSKPSAKPSKPTKPAPAAKKKPGRR